jgi:hypothetical protein
MWGSPRAPRACNKTKILTVVRELLTTVVAPGPLRDMPHLLFINLNGTPGCRARSCHDRLALRHFVLSHHTITGIVGEAKTILKRAIGRAEGASRVLTNVNPPGLNRQIVIALHAPDAHLETGLPMCPPEKSPAPYPVRC